MFPNGQVDIESSLQSAYNRLITQNNVTLTAGCSTILHMFLCQRSFPACADNAPMALCHDQCDLLSVVKMCVGQSLAKQLVAVGGASLQCDQSRATNPHCLPLPSWDKFEVKLSDTQGMHTCAPLSLQSSHLLDGWLVGWGSHRPNWCMVLNRCILICTTTPLSTGDCYSNNGATYSGTVSTSQSGSTCLQWSNSTYMTNLFPGLTGSMSYCRNPGGLGTRPWCFTGSGTMEYCSVSQCKGQWPALPMAA